MMPEKRLVYSYREESNLREHEAGHDSKKALKFYTHHSHLKQSRLSLIVTERSVKG